ncbi:membrane protein [Bacteroidales bacterium]|nr:membrane protein [Bacteroidales bacterium]
MKKNAIRLICLLIFVCVHNDICSQIKHIFGKVLDEKNNPIEFVNIYIKGSIDGTISNFDGTFDLATSSTDTVIIVASLSGYEQYSITSAVNKLDNITIILKYQLTYLDEVTVYAGNYQLKTASTMEQKNAVDLVTTAGSEGDLYKSISLLPGTQASGTDGRLLVRGGASRETQTYIDGMHVLSPYTASTSNFSSRGRYSPFLFEGINFSMGGYSSEYSQSLSAILPLETKNESKITKLGLDIMNVSIGGGGTKSWNKGSSSLNLNLTDLTLYNNIFSPSIKKYWNKPYQQLSAQHQFRFNLGENTYLKTYFAYDKTTFDITETKPFSNTQRDLNYDEDNLYINTTFRKKYKSGLNFFSGIAYSSNNKKINNALILNDIYSNKEKETHIKLKAEKRISNLYKLELGTETMIRRFNLHYTDTTNNIAQFNNSITGFYMSNNFNITHDLFLNLSSRLEYSHLNESYAILPRIALNYKLNDLSISGVLGMYQQSAENENLMYNQKLSSERNTQSLIGFYYNKSNKIYRMELYNKAYNDLTTNNITSQGSGHSRGIDLLFSDTKFLNNWEYMLAYAFNDTKKMYLNFDQKVIPPYVTKHNASFTLKYTNYRIKSIIGITDRFASGRSYDNPNLPGNMNATTPYYNSIDISYTFLANKKIIIYTSFSNLLNRDNIFGYNYNSEINQQGVFEAYPVKLQQNQSFYIGFFITLGKNVAYDVSNF